MILKTDRLVELLNAGKKADATDPFAIIPTPDVDELKRSGAASIDLRLGTWFAHAKQAQLSVLTIGGRQKSSELTTTTYVPFDEKYILHPQSFVLAVTLEWIRLPKDLAAYVTGKSSWGRCGLIIATAVGVHPGYKGCLTLELTNVGEIPLEVRPGVKICQLFVHGVSDTAEGFATASDFAGQRRPTMRPLKLDPFAEKLSQAYKRESDRDD